MKCFLSVDVLNELLFLQLFHCEPQRSVLTLSPSMITVPIGIIDIIQGDHDMNADTSVEIGLLLYPGAQQSSVLGMTDLFEVVNWTSDSRENISRPLIRVSHWQLEQGAAVPDRVFDTMQGKAGEPTVLIVPSTFGPPAEPETAATYGRWLRQQHKAGVTLASVCAGTFVLSEAGLLNGRIATTHWMHAEHHQSLYPEVKIDIDRLVIDDGDIVTAGGAMAWTDLCLKLIDRFLGPSTMIKTARILLIDPPGREQRYYSVFSPNLRHSDAAILKVQHWLQETEAKDMSLDKMATVASLHERTLQRRFLKATGMTTSEYCQRLRVGKAREHLQFSQLSVDSVAWEVGYLDPGAFRKVFSKIVGLTPSEYRKRFTPR